MELVESVPLGSESLVRSQSVRNLDNNRDMMHTPDKLSLSNEIDLVSANLNRFCLEADEERFGNGSTDVALVEVDTIFLP
ncbi:hypothetical protein WICMUC_005866 [Wickerhamomyces mucosus]|uniref:Uncharacterized protein n=1 Tax=Wickerhamomyces mucosus TaxID=1378264 RepID=A0A9P8P322_9ASCO|nr:hypothetical protein WICMUC_005866 [Wickerhamomyces mucosus]